MVHPMTKGLWIKTLGILLILTGSLLTGCLQTTGPSQHTTIIPPLHTTPTTNPKTSFEHLYTQTNQTYTANATSYTLPLNASQIENYDTSNDIIGLTSPQETTLLTNGFVVIPDTARTDDITTPYENLQDQGIPLVITTDTLLHLYHIQFDQTLKAIEEHILYNTTLTLTAALFNLSQAEYDHATTTRVQEAARRNVGFFAVALILLQTPTDSYTGIDHIPTLTYTIPAYATSEVDSELANISAHDGTHTSALFHYDEDYTQYVPRGHYTQSDLLKRYFKTMMWYGRLTFLMKGGDPACSSCAYLVSSEDAAIQTTQASLIATALPSITIQGTSLEAMWNQIYAITSFFVGTADDLTPYDYLTAITTTYGTNLTLKAFNDPDNLTSLITTLAAYRSPQIFGGTGGAQITPPVTPQQLDQLLDKTKGMRVLGQRFIPDSYMFQHLVLPIVGAYTGTDQPFTMAQTQAGPMRCFPRGLDVMAVLGSSRAHQILTQDGDTDYVNYSANLAALQQNFSALNVSQWHRNLYFAWLYSLLPLLHNTTQGSPAFMTTQAWQDKQLATALASWTELRHDTILYAKQSYTPRVTSMPPPPATTGYVEPALDVYTRLLGLTTMTREGLTALNALNETETQRLQSLETILTRLINISIKELSGAAVSKDDYDYINNFASTLDEVVAGVNAQGKQTTLIADVHTDDNTNQVLEEGVGYVHLLVLAYPTADGTIHLGVGPTLSYYEFKQPKDQRLTDEEWRSLLENNTAAQRPAWQDSFIN